MSHSLLVRGCLTALAVALVLSLLRRAGPRWGGLAAALPMTSAPALAWASAEHGPDFAAAAAVAALLTTAMTGLFAMLYAHAARRCTPVGALSVAALPVVGLTVAAAQANCDLSSALCDAILMLLLCGGLLPTASDAATLPSAKRRHDLWMTATIAGLSTTVIGLIAPSVPPLVCGLVAAIPVIGMSTTVSVHRQGGAATVVHFLRGYLAGLWAKVAFLAVLAWSLPQCAPVVAWTCAGLSAVGVTLVLSATPRAASELTTMRRALTG
jgi:hypothetical protein